MDTMLTGEINTTDNIERAENLEIWKSRPLELGVGRPAIKITSRLQLICGRPTLALSSALVTQTLSCLVCVEDS